MLITNIEKNEFDENELKGLMHFSLLDTEISVAIRENVSIEYAEKCAQYLVELSDVIIEKLCEFSIRYCENMREYFDEMEVSIAENIQGREILKHIDPNTLIIEVPKSDEIAFHIELNCDWEEEHGMEWSIRNNQVLYVGSFSDETPWRDKKYFKEASCNYADIDY